MEYVRNMYGILCFSKGSKCRLFYSTIGCSKMSLFEVLKFLEMTSINDDGSDYYLGWFFGSTVFRIAHIYIYSTSPQAGALNLVFYTIFRCLSILGRFLCVFHVEIESGWLRNSPGYILKLFSVCGTCRRRFFFQKMCISGFWGHAQFGEIALLLIFGQNVHPDRH